MDRLRASGSTAGGAALEMAYEIADNNFKEGGNNRIILGTNGDFNVGISSTVELIELVQNFRDLGIYLTICCVGHGNLNESMMEQVANKGDGNYEYIYQVIPREGSKKSASGSSTGSGSWSGLTGFWFGCSRLSLRFVRTDVKVGLWEGYFDSGIL